MAYYYTGGGGPGGGEGASIGVQVGGSNAPTVNDLAGPFGVASVSAGADGVVGGIDGYVGTAASNGQTVVGGNVSIGIGTPGVSGTIGVTGTGVSDIGQVSCQ